MLGCHLQISRLYALVGLLALTSPARAQTVDTAVVVRSVFAFEDARFAAMVRSDTTWLRGALSEALSYVHSSGRRETKTQYLSSVGSGTLRYEEFTPRERQARVVAGGTVAIVVGLAHARAVSNNQPIEVDVRYTAVYERWGNGWQLVAWQTTRIP